MSGIWADDPEDRGDSGSDDDEGRRGGLRAGLAGYAVGLALAAGLSVASFYLISAHLIWGPGIPAALVALAVAQMGVHLVFFLHLTSGPESTNNVLALAFGVMIVFLLLVGTLFIMSHLNHAMPSMDQMMSMQR